MSNNRLQTPGSNKRQRKPKKSTNSPMHPNTMERPLDSPSYPQALLQDYMEIMTSIPNAHLTDSPASSSILSSPKMEVEEQEDLCMLPNPNKQLLKRKKNNGNNFNSQRNSRETPSPSSFYQEDPKFYPSSPSPSTSSYQHSETSENCEGYSSYTESNFGFDEQQSRNYENNQPESFCATDEKTCDALMASMSETPKVKNTFKRSLPSLHHTRSKPNSTDDEEIRLLAEIKATEDDLLKQDLRDQLSKLKKANRIAKRVEDVRELLSNNSIDDSNLYKLCVEMSNRYKRPNMNLEAHIKEWNHKYDPKSSRECYFDEKEDLHKALSNLNEDLPKIYNYKHKKTNYKKFINSSAPVASFRDLSNHQYANLSDEMRDRIINLKLTYYRCAIDNLNDCNKYFPLDYAYNENKSRIRTDYGQNESVGKIRVKNNMASRRSRHRRKYQIFAITNTVDFDSIMINILENAIESATKSIVNLEKKLSDYPNLITEFRTLCCLDVN